MASETFAQALRRMRSARGLSLRNVADLVHYSRQYIHDLEAERRRVPPGLAEALDHALDADGYLVNLAAIQSVQPVITDATPLASGTWREKDAEALAATLIAEPPTVDNALRLAHQWLVADPPQRFELRAGRQIGEDLIRRVEQRVHQIRLLDDHIGGLDTHTVITRELAATAELLREGSYTEAIGRRLLIAVGEMCQIGGWIAADAGRCDDARRLYLAGARAAHAAGDTPGAASNLSSLAYQLANTGDPREAVLLARSAYRGAADAATPAAQALLLERVAWAHARAGDHEDAARALDQVDEAYANRQPDEPAWVYWLSPAEIEVMTGRVWTQLHRPLKAVPALEHAIAGYSEDMPRETALYLTWLAESLIYGSEIDRAAEIASQVSILARQTRSTRVIDRVKDLRRLLEPHRGQPAADSFLDETSAQAGEPSQSDN